MSWQIIIIISIFLNSLGVVLQRLIVKDDKKDPIAFSILFQLVVGGLIGLYGFLFEDMSLPDLGPYALNLFIMTVLWALANIFNFLALRNTEASVFTILFSTRAFFTAIASSFVLGEFLNEKQWLGALVVFSGIVIVSYKKNAGKFDPRLLLSLATAVAFGLANTNDRILLKSLNLYPYVSMAFLLPALGVILYSPKSVANIKYFMVKDSIKNVIFVCIVYAFAAITFFKALQIAPNSSQVAAIGITGVIVTVLLSIIFLKERDRIPQKLIGSVLSFLGVFLLS